MFSQKNNNKKVVSGTNQFHFIIHQFLHTYIEKRSQIALELEDLSKSLVVDSIINC